MARQLIMAVLMASAFVLATFAMTAHAAALKAHNHNHKVHMNTNVDEDVKAHYQGIAKSISDKIKHIIVVMMENRSFDHMFGFYNRDKSKAAGAVNGLTGKEYNLEKVDDLNSKKIYVDDKAPFINQCDPGHSYHATRAKLYGNATFAEACDYKCVNMGGFVHEEHKYKDDNYCNVMQSFNNTHSLSVMTKLAEEFVLMDRFFCSMPGPTWPNRLFHLSATSMGLTETKHYYEDIDKKLFPQKTIFDQVKSAGGEWKLYYNDTPWEMFLESVAHNPEHLHKMTEFFEDAEKGTLPDFAFINPLAGSDINLGGNNDQHPDHDIRLGERYYKDIYEALRAGPKWNETLYIITYDEHGGFHDHVHPPTKVPPPAEGIVSYPDTGFKFDRIGVRIPTLLISPWVPKGLVVSEAPAAQKPTATSEYDLTSIMATSRKLLKKLEGVPALTKRDEWASTFEHVVEMLDAPRTDCPMHLPEPGKPLREAVEAEGRLPINDLQAEIITMHHHLAEPDSTEQYPSTVQTQSQVGPFAIKSFEKHRARTLRWKAGKGRLSKAIIAKESVEAPSVHDLRMVAPVVVSAQKSWTIGASPKAQHVTIHNGDAEKPLCFDIMTGAADMDGDVAAMAVGTPVKVNHCYPSANPAKNRDQMQWWTINTADSTIRPSAKAASGEDLCLSATAAANGYLVLAKCDATAAAQKFVVDAAAKTIAFADGSALIAH